jgi:hypothetical protein
VTWRILRADVLSVREAGAWPQHGGLAGGMGARSVPGWLSCPVASVAEDRRQGDGQWMQRPEGAAAGPDGGMKGGIPLDGMATTALWSLTE